MAQQVEFVIQTHISVACYGSLQLKLPMEKSYLLLTEAKEKLERITAILHSRQYMTQNLQKNKKKHTNKNIFSLQHELNPVYHAFSLGGKVLLGEQKN